MSLRKRVIPNNSIREIIDVFNLFLDSYASGLLCFFGDERFPDVIDLADLFSSSHSSDDVGPVDGGSSTPRAVSIVESAECITSVIDSFGGLDVFVDVFCEFEKEMPERAKILRDLSAVGSLRFSSVEDVAWHNHVSKRHLYRLKNASLYQIAMEISRRKMWRK